MMKKRAYFCLTLALTLILAVSFFDSSYAATAFKSNGRLEYNNGTPNDSSDDVVFDASDLTTLDTKASALDTRISTLSTKIDKVLQDILDALNKYPGVDLDDGNGGGTPPSLEDIIEAITNLTDIPADTYFYEDGTEGDENIVRYKKINGKYYLCNAHGEVADRAVEVNVSQKVLIDYSAAAPGHISAGRAAYADGRLNLGDGSDNTAYYEQGSTENKILTRVKIGSGSLSSTKTFSITGHEGWENFTLDNFAIVATGATVVEGSGAGVNIANSYNSQTGILSIGAKHGATILSDGRHMRGYATYEVYLIY